MLPQLAAGAILTGTILFVYWWFRPPQITPVGADTLRDIANRASREGDNPNQLP